MWVTSYLTGPAPHIEILLEIIDLVPECLKQQFCCTMNSEMMEEEEKKKVSVMDGWMLSSIYIR